MCGRHRKKRSAFFVKTFIFKELNFRLVFLKLRNVSEIDAPDERSEVTAVTFTFGCDSSNLKSSQPVYPLPPRIATLSISNYTYTMANVKIQNRN